ncbi:hypothetical protein B0T17DRAFT_245674 [Bombardia bombarda]|uniref:DUF7708 domain-containing protein n=1 Tax=Bombardia bombarda TaxID=252184 RepID=A0AA40C413_9PEZI|nr:hypothetical protein B0T17DRAFT_245674 [Bombardia bombarda]
MSHNSINVVSTWYRHTKMDLPTHLTAEPEDIELEQTPSSPKLDPSAEGVVNKLNDDQCNPVQGSKDKLQKRLAGFLQHATEAERNAVDETREKLSKTLETALLAQSKRYPDQDGAGIRASLSANMKKGWARTSEVAYQYAQMLDVMVGQAPEFVGLVYGAVKIIIVVQVNYEETKQKMEKYLNEISSKFGLVDHLVAYIPTARLVAALGQAYSLFTLFLAKAVKFYTQNRRRLYLKALSKPWDRLQVFVDGINQALLEANDIAQFHGLITTHANLMVSQETLAVVRKNETGIMQTQARVERLLSQVEAITIYFSKKKDMQETANLVQQQAMEMLENPFQDQSKPLASEDSRSHSQSQPNSGAGATETNPEEDPVDRLRQDIFVELQDHLEHLGARKRAVEQFPDMGPHRSKQRNLLRSEKFMDWVESQTSQLLWVDANHVVSRPDFNASFAIPLLLVGESKYESVVVLRHFIAETGTTKRHHALVQSLLLQIFEQNPTVYQKKRGSITREDSSNLERLWNIFKDCMQQ